MRWAGLNRSTHKIDTAVDTTGCSWSDCHRLDYAVRQQHSFQKQRQDRFTYFTSNVFGQLLNKSILEYTQRRYSIIIFGTYLLPGMCITYMHIYDTAVTLFDTDGFFWLYSSSSRGIDTAWIWSCFKIGPGLETWYYCCTAVSTHATLWKTRPAAVSHAHKQASGGARGSLLTAVKLMRMSASSEKRGRTYRVPYDYR